MAEQGPGGVIDRLPDEILEMILDKVAQCETDEFEFSAGGRLVAWDHYNHAARLALVKKSWLRPAQSVLYRSVSLRGSVQATCFTCTARARPDLAARVRRLSLGLGDTLEMTIPERGQVAASAALLGAAEACPHVLHLHFRPLACTSRDRLVAFLGRHELESIVVAPRAADPLAMRWCHGLTRYGDFAVPALRGLRFLEGDMYCLPPPDHGLMLRQFRRFEYPKMQIRLMKFDSDMPTVWLLKLIKATGPTLEVLDIYHEQAIDPDAAYEALLTATKSLVRLRWRMNPFLPPDGSSSGSRSPSPPPSPPLSPALGAVHDDLSASPSSRAFMSGQHSALSSPLSDPRPLFDRLLPRFERLARLSTSSESITPTLLGVRLPRSLENVEVHTFQGEDLYRPADQIKALARAPPVAPGPELVGLTFVGNRSLWTEEELRVFTRQMARRGVRFRHRDAALEEGEEAHDGASEVSDDFCGGR